MRIVPVSGIDRWRDASPARPVRPAAAPPPPGRSAAGRSTLDEPIDVEVLWEELEAAIRATPAQPDVTPLGPSPAVVAGAYAAATRRASRGSRVDLAVA